MSVEPFLSVIIPTYNRRELLRQTLGCLFRQSCPAQSYEIIVVDDGSQDGTVEDLAALAAMGLLRYLAQPNRGPAAARNAGARLARGAILAFTDADCLPEADWLAQLHASYSGAAGAARVAVGGPVSDVGEGHWTQQFAAVHTAHRANADERPRFLDTANASYRREVFLALGGFDERYTRAGSEDVDLSLRVVAAGYSLERNPRAVVGHVGRSTLMGLLRQAWGRGLNDAILLTRHPALRAGPPSRGLRLLVRRAAMELARAAAGAPRPLRPPARAATAGLLAALLTIPEIEYVARSVAPAQRRRYRELGVTGGRLAAYLLLGWAYHLLRLAGEIVGKARLAYSDETEVPGARDQRDPADA